MEHEIMTTSSVGGADTFPRGEGKGDTALSAVDTGAVADIVRQIMTPVMESFAKMLRQNTEAMERIAATQQMMATRISDLEKEIRLKTPLSRAQEKHLNEAMRRRAKELLEPKGLADERKAVNKLAAVIRKSVLARYGADSLREAPAYDYDVAMESAAGWYDALAVREVVKSLT